ncbi:hypothetical protein [Pseudomonas lutea]|uniref:Uncharacterized protein n=1 Tax=Pseudomonas lutea TaxID=243924 RepID=A0A9X0JK58_9PSED|nr:hypothetical protein [Pseudomonas lutea]KGF65551.1 hypothetical protein LT42_06365 [Pseudomonas lutea]
MINDAASQPRHDVIRTKALGLIFFIACLVLAALALSYLFQYWHIGMNAEIPVFAEVRVPAPSQLNPEPIERSVFILLAALAPIGLVIAGKLFRGFDPGFWGYILLSTAACILLVAPFVTSDFAGVMFFPTSLISANRLIMLVLAALLSAAAVLISFKGIAGRRSYMGWTIGTAVAAAIVFQVAPYRLASDRMVTLASQWSVSYDAATYALTQVVGGKTLLHDLPSQYGLFPELIAPIFKLIDISVLTVSTLFIVLQLIALSCLAAVLHIHVRNPLLRAMTFLCLLISTGLFLYLNDIKQEIYVQYYPIRFICPSVALFLFARYCLESTRTRLTVLGIASGVAVFWNFDSGIPVLVSIGATLLVKPFFIQPLRWRVLGPAFAFSIFAALTFGLLMAILRLKAGGPLGIQEAASAQKLFYGSGFMMLPMPLTFHPWQLVLVAYAAAAVAAVSAWRRHVNNHVYDVLFCAGIMGLGLFTYYQGRSHIYCLMMVLWPALIVGAILTDLILRSMRKRSTSFVSGLLALPFVFFVSLGTVTLAFSARDLVLAGVGNVVNYDKDRDPVIASELAFLRATSKGRDCLILAQRQAIYHAELKTASPLTGPGLIETLLQSDLDGLMAGALSKPLECIYLGVGSYSQTLLKLDDDKLISKYPVSAQNDLGTLLLLEPPTSVPAQ